MTGLEKLMNTAIGAGIIEKMAKVGELQESEIRWSIHTKPIFRNEFLKLVQRVTDACKRDFPDMDWAS